MFGTYVGLQVPGAGGTGGPPLGPGDALFGNVILQLLGNEPAGSTTFIDSSQYARAVTTYHNPFTFTTSPISSSAKSKFGGTSIYGGNNGNGNQLYCSQDAPEFACEDWCIDTWVYRTLDMNYFGFACFNNLNMFYLLRSPVNSGAYELMVARSAALMYGNAVIPVDQWVHIALTAEKTGIGSSVLRFFVDGVLDNTLIRTSDLSTMLQTGGNSFSIGRTDSAGFGGIIGYLNGYRVTAGTPRWTANFTPPSSASDYGPPGIVLPPTTAAPPTTTAAAGTVTVGASVSMGGTMGVVPPALFTVGIRPKGGTFGLPKTLAQGATTFHGEILSSPGGPAYTVEWETYDIASVAGVHYTAASGTVGASDSTPQPISVTVVPPANYYGAPGYIFGVRLKNPTGRTIAAGADDVVITAPSNTTIPTLTYAATSTPGNFGLFAEYEWTLSHPSAFPESIQYSLGMLPASPAYTSGSILSSQYSVDGGATYLPLGPGGGGTFVLPAMTSSFRIRQNTTLQAVQNANINPTMQMGLFSPMWQFQYVNGPLFWLPAP